MPFTQRALDAQRAYAVFMKGGFADPHTHTHVQSTYAERSNPHRMRRYARMLTFTAVVSSAKGGIRRPDMPDSTGLRNRI
jgi:hypothetical protein